MTIRATNPSLWLSRGVCLCLLVIAGCSSESRFEGELAGDCTNAADDDRDGDFDCDDEGCSGSPACDGVTPDAGGSDAGPSGPIDSGPGIIIPDGGPSPDSGTPPSSCAGTITAEPGQMRYVVRNGGNTQTWNRTLTTCGTSGGSYVVTDGKMEIELPSFPGAIPAFADGTLDDSFTGGCSVCFDSAREGKFGCTLTDSSGTTVTVMDGAFSCS